ncbi:MAG: molybdenum cofactor guanylyltransferase [Syntrophobacteraceae bacterium]
MLTGAILAGGKSRRFGKNKAFEVFQGTRMIDRGVESLQTVCNPVMVVANDLSLYYDLNVTLVRDILPDLGPLCGIYTALLFSPHDWVFVKAADMPFLVPELIPLMLSMKDGFDVVVPVTAERFEPLLALYHRRCLTDIASLLEKCERKVRALYENEHVRVATIPEEKWRTIDPDGLSIKNINTPDDWAAIISKVHGDP